MRPTRASKTIAAWIAALGILMAALAPALSQALGGDAQASQVEVCTALGPKFITVGESKGAPQPSNGSGHLFEHCPYCSLHAAIDAMPPAPAAALALLTLSFAAPRLFLLAPRSSFAWTTPQSRAPPLSA
jgi:hypothetical protein